jgi:hypothetical protein
LVYQAGRKRTLCEELGRTVYFYSFLQRCAVSCQFIGVYRFVGVVVLSE